MGEAYFNLSRKLEDLGYNNKLPIEAVPLVESILADLLQTTRSLQHYMDLSKEAIMQRDSLMLEAEPYKCDNAKLIQESNKLHKENMQLREDYLKFTKESKRKIKSLSEELVKKDSTINKLQYEVRELSLRGLCAETQSSRNKSRRKDNDQVNKICLCNEKIYSNSDKEVTELTKKIQLLEEKNMEFYDEIMVLKSQIEHRDNEIIRLNILLEGGRPLSAINKDCCNPNIDSRVQSLMKELREMEIANDLLKKEVERGLAKQHEAMLRALSLADRNKTLQEELQKVDSLALKVEDDANKRLASMLSEINFLQTRIEGLTLKNSELEREISTLKTRNISPKMLDIQESLNSALKENNAMHKEIKDLVELNKSLQDKILSLPHMNKSARFNSEYEHLKDKCRTKYELQTFLEDEKKMYEKYIKDIQEKMTETMKDFNKHLQNCRCKESPITSKDIGTTYEASFVRDLHTKLCESEQKMLVLKKENDEYKIKLAKQEENNRQNYKDVINQLNVENSELTKENINLSQQLSQYKNLHLLKSSDRGDYSRDVKKLKIKIDEMTHELQLLKKDKQEYNMKYKEAMDLADKLKRDLVFKQNEIERLEDENNSYKRTNRTEKASTDHLKDECNFLREQLKKIQSDMIKEKSITNQIKNIQVETERSTNSIQNELLCAQKKLSLSKETIDSLEFKCKELQNEIISLRADKSNLIESIKKVDQERDKLVIELDNKVESNSFLEQKLKSKTFEMTKLEEEIKELKRKLNVNKISEHKIADYEAQISFLNGEILRLNQQLDTAVMENKQLQNSLADANGTIKINKIEYEKSRKEVECLKQQLQHYVSEIRRIEELLSQKEAERSDMLEQFASLSVEANILENTNHSLESESASKSVQLQTYISKIEMLESKIMDKENMIESQSSRIAAMSCKINALENEIKLITEEKIILEQNISYLKQMCSNLKSEHTARIGDGDSELKIYENRIKSLSRAKENLEFDKCKLKDNLATTEKLLSNARKEIVELKLALQDATSETKSLQDSVNRLSRRDPEIHETTLTTEHFDLPLMLEEIHEVSHEEDDESLPCHAMHKRLSKYSSGTL
ncbi:centrosomal protein of 135 kDa-like [Manduca sexta]|uniref:Centrosomal protein of 135 kDa n=1 Tax=Manduca sexta TaxID=7130 RepID=A0A921YTI6_MANSE|nr:centrosomal protein of 135 kDa-like [Manduca sexta]KAG6444790.1 hypothetical protein O3G_MSEX003566 [Manduca sexta]